MQDLAHLQREVARLKTLTGADEAATWLAAQLERDAGDPAEWRLLADLHSERDDTAAALAAIGRALALAPHNPMLLFLRAKLTLDAGLPAADLFRALRRAHPVGDLVLLGEATALTAEGRGEAAAELVARALANRPGWAQGHAFLARLLAERGDADCCHPLDAALANRPGDAALFGLRLSLAMEAGHHGEALGLLATAPGEEADWLGHRAVCLDELGESAAAAVLFDQLGPPRERGLAVRMVRHCLRRGDPAGALALADRWLATEAAQSFWPYVSLAWRMTGDPRAEWLEGDALIGVHDLSESQSGSLAELAEALRAIHTRSGQPSDQSLRGGSQTMGSLFARVEPAIRRLRGALAEAVGAHAAGMGQHDPAHPILRFRRDRPVSFAGSWSVRLMEGGHHVPHVHPEGWLSAVFYVAVPSRDHGTLLIGEPEPGLGLPLRHLREVQPRPGRLVIMPSTMWHGTRPSGGGERITVAFDVSRPNGSSRA